MSHRIVMTEVHRLSLRTPQPHSQLSFTTSTMTHLHRRGVRLPEILQPHGKSALRITYEYIAGRTVSCKSSYPRTYCRCTLTYGKSIVSQLGKPETIPLCPVLHIWTNSLRDGVCRDMSTFELRCTQQGVVAALFQQLYRLRPHAAVVSSKSHMTVIGLLSHRDL